MDFAWIRSDFSAIKKIEDAIAMDEKIDCYFWL
jgi:hypothetical protein